MNPETRPKKIGLLARLKGKVAPKPKKLLIGSSRNDIIDAFKGARREFIRRNPRARMGQRVSMREWARTHARGIGTLSRLCSAFLGSIQLRNPGTPPLARSGKAPSLAERKRRSRRNTTTRKSRRNG